MIIRKRARQDSNLRPAD